MYVYLINMKRRIDKKKKKKKKKKKRKGKEERDASDLANTCASAQTSDRRNSIPVLHQAPRLRFWNPQMHARYVHLRTVRTYDVVSILILYPDGKVLSREWFAPCLAPSCLG